MHILIVEDERTLCDTIARSLRRLAYSVDCCYDGQSAAEMLAVERFDLVVLDLNLPGEDGMTVLRTLRERDRDTKVLILSARCEVADKVAGLDAGANDYIRKPFELRELIVRIKALLRRCDSDRSGDIIFKIGRYSFNVSTQTLSFGDSRTELSHFEARILEYLAMNIGKTVDSTALMMAVWQRDEPSNRNSLHGYIHKLRRALRHDASIAIINQRGFGYMLTVRED